MGIIVCDQFAILGAGCPECEASIHRLVRDGFPDQHGVRYCSEDCIADHQEHVARLHAEGHYATRDLLCECGICAARGLPSQEMRDEHAAYLATVPDHLRQEAS